MTSSQSAENNNGMEIDDGNELDVLRREVLSLREIEKEQTETTASLLTELQRRCDNIIELEVRLDKERERANRLERQRKEDEALSGELRELMANVDTSDSKTPEYSSAPAESDTISPNASFNKTPSHTDASKRPIQEDEETKSAPRSAYGPLQGVGGLLADWGIPVGGRGHTNARGKSTGGGNSSREGSGAPEEFPSTTMTEEASGGGGWSRSSPGALKARVVELELQRAETEELMKERADQSLRLQVQVEQLKNVVQSLSHASSGWEGAGGRNGESPPSGKGDAEIVDLGPLLRDVPDVDPSVLLTLHRTPWAEDVCEGIRKQETCFEWQGKDSRGVWSSKQSTLPSELSSLPYKPPQKPGSGQETPPMPLRLQDWASFPSSQEKDASSFAGTPLTAADRTAPSTSERAGKRGIGLGGRIGEAVSAFGGVGMWMGREDGGGVFTNESVSGRFSLRDVELPSNHWEWVGGWIPDAEDDASADEDGWIYGRTPSEIANISEMAQSRGRCENVSEVSEQMKNAQIDKEDGATRKSGEWTIHIPVGKKSAEAQKGVGGGGGMMNGERGGRSSACDTAAMVRRRRLVRLRTVVRLDGARDSTNKFLETMRRVCSLEILVRKLSQQVVSLHRQVTGLEGQVAFLVPLQPKLRQACALGRKDRQRGDALQRRLIEAENELKVLKRCMGSFATPPAPSESNLPVVAPSDRDTKRNALARASDEVRTVAPGGVNSWYDGSSAGYGENEGKEQNIERQGSWGWVGGVAQRAAGNLSLSRRSFSFPAGGAVAGKESAKVDDEGGVEEQETGRLGEQNLLNG